MPLYQLKAQFLIRFYLKVTRPGSEKGSEYVKPRIQVNDVSGCCLNRARICEYDGTCMRHCAAPGDVEAAVIHAVTSSGLGEAITERTSMIAINDPAILAEASAAFEAYEVALMTNDMEAMDALFWHSPLTVRYGTGDAQYGIDEIREFRKARAGGSPQRKVIRRSVTTFGSHFAVTNIEFIREDSPSVGRQSQSWTKFPEGWRVVSAHVSLQKAAHSPLRA